MLGLTLKLPTWLMGAPRRLLTQRLQCGLLQLLYHSHLSLALKCRQDQAIKISPWSAAALLSLSQVVTAMTTQTVEHLQMCLLQVLVTVMMLGVGQIFLSLMGRP